MPGRLAVGETLLSVSWMRIVDGRRRRKFSAGGSDSLPAASLPPRLANDPCDGCDDDDALPLVKESSFAGGRWGGSRWRR